MKVRLSESGVRLRLAPGELEKLAQTEITLSVPLPGGGAWRCDLGLHEGTFRAEAAGGILRVRLPREEALAWLAGRELEWEFTEGAFRLSVEKDAKPNRL